MRHHCIAMHADAHKSMACGFEHACICHKVHDHTQQQQMLDCLQKAREAAQYRKLFHRAMPVKRGICVCEGTHVYATEL